MKFYYLFFIFQADMKPPENVLFVCKLNAVTTDEDLETIFSRFGEILSCEIIRDKKSGDSLCYAFIEYENEEDAEQAYFTMDNVLIDDRRIHVDFSQSVAKAKWEYDKKQRQLKALKAQPVPPPRSSSSSTSKTYKAEEKHQNHHRSHDRDHYHRDRDHHHDRSRDRDRDRDRNPDRNRDRHYRDNRHRRDRSRS
jgi:peptidyl-prolyl cis-trans isomerase-like 4